MVGNHKGRTAKLKDALQKTGGGGTYDEKLTGGPSERLETRSPISIERDSRSIELRDDFFEKMGQELQAEVKGERGRIT